MNIAQEKRLLLSALTQLRSERSNANSIDEQLDLTDRLANISHCLESLNWSEVNMRVKNQPVFYRLYIRWPNQNAYSAVDWKAGKQVKNLIYASFFTEMEKEKVESELVNQTTKNAGMAWDWRKV